MCWRVELLTENRMQLLMTPWLQKWKGSTYRYGNAYSCSYANSSLIDDQTAGDQLINCEVVGKWQRELENNYEIITRLHCVIEKTA